MTIKDRNLKAGTRLVARYHKQPYACQVVEGEGGKLRYHLEDGREFKSPSAAGVAITGKSCNGWAFWSVETTGTTPAPAAGQTEVPTEPPKESAPAAEKPAPVMKIFRTPNQKGTGRQTRWYCHDCGKSFLADIGVLPETCPQGHKA